MIELPEIIDAVVSSMRTTGTSDFVGGVTTATNDFLVGNWVNIGGTKYKVTVASSTSFTVSSTLANASYTWNALAPYYYWGTKKEILTRLSDKDSGSTLKSQKYPMIALQVPFTISNYEGLSPDIDGIGSASDISILFVADSTRDNSLPYEDRLNNIITPQLTPLVSLFKRKLDFYSSIAYAETIEVTTIPNFGTESSQGREKIVTLDPWEVKEGKYNLTITEC